MGIYVSSLLYGMGRMEECAQFIQKQSEYHKDLGVELIAFTHDELYKKRLEQLLKSLTCPISFHGPYIGVEATAKKETPENEWLFESYDYVFNLAKQHHVKHVVFHYTQKGFSKDTIADAKEQSLNNIAGLIKLAKKYNVNMLVENIAFIQNTIPLYNNEEYKQLFSSLPEAESIIDIGHANVNNTDLIDLLNHIGPRVKAYHLHNNDGIHDLHDRVRDGNFDMKKFADIYRKLTPGADLILEYEPHTKTTSEQLLDDIDYIRKIFH